MVLAIESLILLCRGRVEKLQVADGCLTVLAIPAGRIRSDGVTRSEFGSEYRVNAVLSA